MKKTALFIFLVLLFELFPVIQSSAETESLINGSFENVENTAPSGWTPMGGNFGVEFTVDTRDPVSGSNTLKIASSQNAYAAQHIALAPGQHYQFSGYIKVEKLNSGAFGAVKLEFSDPSYNKIITFATAENKWKKMDYAFTAPAAPCNLMVLIRIVGGGTVYFDDVSLLFSGALANGSFESMDTANYPSSWFAYGSWGTYGDKCQGYAGTGVTIKNQNTTINPYISQNITNVLLSHSYTLSGYFKCAAGTSAGIKVEAYSGSNNTSGKTNTLIGNGSWKYFEYDISTNDTTTSFIILLRLFGAGECCFDEISLEVNSATVSADMRVKPKDIFAYSDITSGQAAVEVFREIPQNGKINVSVCDGETELESYSFSAAKAVNVSYSNLLMSVLGREYTLKVTLVTALGSEIASSSEKIYRYKRPTQLNSDGIFVNHAKEKVYPVTAYHVPVNEYYRMPEIGVNVVQCGYTSSNLNGIQTALDKAAEVGIYAMIPLYANMKPAAHPDNIAMTLACIERFKNHPALYAWMVMDEPQPDNDVMYELLKASYKLIRDNDSDHPIYICECNESSLEQSGKCCDILCVDPYPDKLSNINKVYDFTIAALEAVSYQKPVYNLLQAWKWTDWEPDSTQLRNMAFQAFFAGATGIGYYPIHDGDSNIWLLELLNGAASLSKYELEEAFKAFVSGETACTVSSSNGVRYGVHGEYVTAVNTTGSEKSVVIPTSAVGKAALINGDISSSAAMTPGGLAFSIKGYGALTYRITEDPVITLWIGNAMATSLKNGTYTLKKTNTDSSMTIAALYIETNGISRLANLYDLTGSGTFMVSLETGKKYKLRLFCLESFVSMQPMMSSITITN